MLYHQRTRLPDAEERTLGAAHVPLDDLLARCDYLIPQLPAGPTTRHLIDRARLSRLKPGAIIVNVSRPDVIERAALIEFITSGHLGGVALDPPYETPMREDDALLAHPNVVLSPQLAGSPRANALRDFEDLVIGVAKEIAS